MLNRPAAASPGGVARLHARVRARPDLVFAGLLLSTWRGAGLYAGIWIFQVHSAGQLTLGHDSHAYWLASRRARLYSGRPEELNAYLYSPAFAELIRPLTLLPARGFGVLWSSAELLTFVWLLRPLRWYWLVPLLLLSSQEIFLGNIHAYFALALVIVRKRPAIATLFFLTKLTPAVALLWFAFDRKWKAVIEAVTVSAGIAMLSFPMNEAAWRQWVTLLRTAGDHSGPGLLMRGLLAVLVVAIGHAVRQFWLVAVAVTLAAPVVVGLTAFTVLLAIPRILQPDGVRPACAHG